jgi:hypothetical protein
MGVIDELLGTLGMGARANKYMVNINSIEAIFDIGSMGNILAKSTTIPGRSFNEVSIWNQGRLTTIAGDADYSGTWSVTFRDTEDHELRSIFINWMEFIGNVTTHEREATSHNAYMSTAQVSQLSTIDNSVTATYEFYDIWPKSISDSSLSDDAQDMIEFTIEFNFTSWTKID